MFEVLFVLTALIFASLSFTYLLLFSHVVRSELSSRNNALVLQQEPDTSVIVFGAKAWKEGPSPELEARLDTALLLEKKIRPNRYFLYGGVDHVDETEVMKTYLMNGGVKAEKVILDNLGINTRNSIERFKLAIENFPSTRLIAISSGYHALRIQIEGRRRKLNFVVISPQTSPEVANSRVHFIRVTTEVIAIIWYLIPRVLTDHINTNSNTFRHKIPSYFINKTRRY